MDQISELAEPSRHRTTLPAGAPAAGGADGRGDPDLPGHPDDEPLIVNLWGLTIFDNHGRVLCTLAPFYSRTGAETYAEGLKMLPAWEVGPFQLLRLRPAQTRPVERAPSPHRLGPARVPSPPGRARHHQEAP
ncbi:MULTISPECIES: hypothetical protein [unclassified Pseudofrankia]|uniref:hypothetical protein n=1 Tax=unclassified Pseudofrankia TaxID=2994372 RepID=UPI0010420A1F|nr:MULTISPECIES: hypothetical protein [unclassified Pseudofrankia]MDT3443345.1 hypothetical protein [Pseudofrankia sp. BMG5.37]